MMPDQGENDIQHYVGQKEGKYKEIAQLLLETRVNLKNL